MSLSTEFASSSTWEEIYLTFLASIRSVGTACTMAAVGIYLHRQGYILGDGKRTLALISQQVTIPLLFFTKILHCNQDWSDDPCPDVTQSLRDVWVLLIWPLYVVGIGFLVGFVMAKISGTPKQQIRAVLAACGFSNSTGLPITLLTVVHANFPSTSDLGRVDPCLFLSVYLLLYPVLQWGIGGWLLAPVEEEPKHDDDIPKLGHHKRRRSSGFAHNVLNQKPGSFYEFSHRGIGETDASMYMSVHENLNQFGGYQYTKIKPPSTQTAPSEVSASDVGLDLFSNGDHASSGDLEAHYKSPDENTSLLTASTTSGETTGDCDETDSSISESSSGSKETLQDTFQKVLGRCFQPPVVGALLGLIIASQPSLRGVFVDLVDRSGDAPLEWFYDGLYAVGQAAVPINMIILGCNLSASYENNNNSSKGDSKEVTLFSPKTTMAVVMGKMVVMPIIGFLSAYFFKTYWWDIPDEINGSFYLVILIVFLTPTANNVMVMVELSGSGSKEAIARLIAWQYATAPIILCTTMTAAVGIANHWS